MRINRKINKMRLLGILLTLCLIVGLFPLTVSASSSGSCGATAKDNVTWTLDDNGLLTISGTGAMANYTMMNTNPQL